MRRIVLDTNCLLQSLPSESPYHRIWESVLEGQISLCVNNEILDEYEEIYDDPDDNKFVDCAVAAQAEYIVTNDKHFNVLNNLPWPKLVVLNIKEFVKQLL